MTDFDTLFQSMAVPVLRGSTGETVVYRPVGGAARTITAIQVDRNPIAVIDGIPQALGTHFVVTVENDVTRGILATEFNDGGDEMDVAPRPGAARVTKTITKKIEDKGGMLTLEVR